MSDPLHRTAFKRLIGNNPRYFILSNFSYNQLLYLQFRQSWQLGRDESGEIFSWRPPAGPFAEGSYLTGHKKRAMFGIPPPRLPWCLGTPWMRRKTTCTFGASYLFPTCGFSDDSLLCLLEPLTEGINSAAASQGKPTEVYHILTAYGGPVFHRNVSFCNKDQPKLGFQQ